MPRHVAIYLRVSSAKQDTGSQEPDLERWAQVQDQPVKWYSDTFTGRTMNRPGWQKLAEAMRTGQVSQVVVWRIDRLGRTARGLTALFEELLTRNVNFVSLRDGTDLSTPTGRLMATVIAGVAQYENEVRLERVLAGQAKAKKDGTTWGGSPKGRVSKKTSRARKRIQQMSRNGEPVSVIARAVGLSRRTVCSVLKTSGSQ